mmetsp:Transcript_14740/g.46368  ORF Transcript_14740/g.46368 Transcript_14740/m.46368 type:complete len:559 (-) Transcript_14740:119-1795(-)
MIDYDTGDWMWRLVCRRSGSVVPHALLTAVPSALLAVLLVYLAEHVENFREDYDVFNGKEAILWTALTIPLTMLITFRTSQALGRFWEGTGLLHAMRGEWFDSASCLATFTFPAKQSKPEAVAEFRHTLLRLMSLCHGSALDEIRSAETESYEVLDIRGLHESTISILRECKNLNFNRVEVILHMIQVLVIKAQGDGVINIPAPILSRVYQTLSRGFVNLLSAKKIKATRFPFPYAQLIALLLLLTALMTPVAMSSLITSRAWCGLATFVPVFGLLCMNYAAEQLEMPFGEDDNDLPLMHFQEEMNTSLLMLIHDCSDHVARTNDRCKRDYQALSQSLKDLKRMRTSSTVCHGARKREASIYHRSAGGGGYDDDDDGEEFEVYSQGLASAPLGNQHGVCQGALQQGVAPEMPTEPAPAKALAPEVRIQIPAAAPKSEAPAAPTGAKLLPAEPPPSCTKPVVHRSLDEEGLKLPEPAQEADQSTRALGRFAEAPQKPPATRPPPGDTPVPAEAPDAHLRRNSGWKISRDRLAQQSVLPPAALGLRCGMAEEHLGGHPPA